MKAFWIIFFSLAGGALWAQGTGPFAPAAGLAGSTAIDQNSSLIQAWAQQCRVVRGAQDIARPNLGLATTGDSSLALGPADSRVVSLGDSGYAEFRFSPPLQDQAGFEFAIFENGFSADFLELAFVEISSNGLDFVRFPATSLTPTASQVGPFDLLDPTQIDGLAGKYEVGYGTPFDFQVLADSSRINIGSISHIRVVDVIGAIGQPFSTRDHLGNEINDPYPTDFASGGFDLDALALLAPQTIDSEEWSAPKVAFYPSVVSERWWVPNAIKTVRLYRLDGSPVLTIEQSGWQDLSALESGLYLAFWEDQGGRQGQTKLLRR